MQQFGDGGVGQGGCGGGEGFEYGGDCGSFC